ncbi:MAG: NUDIX domain-containing protein [Candidatus Nealsonbacteria bacterium]|nr:NUDIX domain-containing protein [Candidatus Nealsonbacteria bacterium]
MEISRAAAIAFINKEGKVLFQHRDSDAPSSPNCWGLFGGAMEEGETPEKGIKREVEEELQIKLKDFKLFGKYEFREEGIIKERYIFTAPLNHSLEILREQQREGDDLALLSFKEMQGLKTSSHTDVILKDLFETITEK